MVVVATAVADEVLDSLDLVVDFNLALMFEAVNNNKRKKNILCDIL